MSNTSSITPYSGSGSSIGAGAGIAAACVVSAVAVTASVAKWLIAETGEDREAVRDLKDRQREERLELYWPDLDIMDRCMKPMPFTTVNLNLRNVESLIRSAESMGYELVRQDRDTDPLEGRSYFLLQGSSGKRLVIEQNEDGRLAIHSAGEVDSIESLVQRHTLDRVVEHLAERCTDVKTMVLSSGEVQILAKERDRGAPGGAAEIKAQVRPDGRLWVDVDKVKGNRCTRIVSDIARAIGAEVESMRRKEACFQLPGEPTRTKVKI